MRFEPIPLEGGWFCATWRTEHGSAIVAKFTDAPDGFSALHRLGSDEVWHFYSGDPFVLVTISPAGAFESVTLGPDAGFQHVVPAGTWMGGYVDGAECLLGATLAPPFDEAAFELGDRAALIELCPSQATLITRLTRE